MFGIKRLKEQIQRQLNTITSLENQLMRTQGEIKRLCPSVYTYEDAEARYHLTIGVCRATMRHHKEATIAIVLRNVRNELEKL